MKVNTLVKLKSSPSLGIGCVSKELKKSCKVNFGSEANLTCKKSDLVEVDVSGCKTVPFKEFQMRIMQDNSTLNNVILGNEIYEYVGIGWIPIRVITMADLKVYPRVI